MRVEDLLFRHAARRPSYTAVVCGNRRLTYEELVKTVKARAPTRRVGERVAIQLPNSIEFVEQAYAAWAAGAVVVPINTRLAPREIDFIREDMNADRPSEREDCLILYTSGTTV